MGAFVDRLHNGRVVENERSAQGDLKKPQDVGCNDALPRSYRGMTGSVPPGAEASPPFFHASCCPSPKNLAMFYEVGTVRVLVQPKSD